MRAARMKAQPQNVVAIGLIVKARWPNGVKCPLCESREVTPIQSRGIFQCNGCRRQFSVFKGTNLERMRITPVQLGMAIAAFFGGSYELSVRDLQRKLGTTSLSTAQRLMKKLKSVSYEANTPFEEVIRRLLLG